MRHQFTLRYWQDDGWFVGQLEEVPNVMSQGETLAELETNIQEVYSLLFDDSVVIPEFSSVKELELEV